MADLPMDRTMPGKPPFTYVGMDCFGPFYIKRGRSQVKRYGCLFTCLTIRAIHIEKLDTLDTDSFLNALMRFSARRGTPDKVRSDNGTNFVGGQRELRQAVRSWKEDSKVKGQLLQKEIKWEFNPPAASHMGGVWERQIRTVRKVLNAIIKNQTLDDERLATLFCEVESIVNDRPLTLTCLTTPGIQNRSLQTICSYSELAQGWPQENSRRKTSTGSVGDTCSTWPTSLGNAGSENICPPCSYDGNGYNQRGI